MISQTLTPGGRGWIRTTEVIDDGFTVRCIWPLCNLPKWSRWSESNQQPSDYKSDALPLSHTSKCANLRFRLVGAAGRNRTTDTGIFSPLLYRLSYKGILATRMRLELTTSSVTGWRSNQLNYRAKLVGVTGLEPVTLCL